MGIMNRLLLSGVYFIKQVKIKEWPKGTILLTTTPSTCIKISDKKIKNLTSSLKEQISYAFIFPPILFSC